MKIHVASAFVVIAAVAAQGCHRSQAVDGSAEGGAAAAAPGSLAAGPLAFLQGFEGEIGIAAKSNKGKGEAVNLAFAVKSDKVRVEIPQGIAGPGQPSPKGFVVLDTPEKKLIAVIDEMPPMLQKTAIVVDLNTIGEQFKSMVPQPSASPGGKDKPSKPPPKLAKNGTSDKIAGYPCDNWDVTEESKKVATMCIADQSNSWFHLPTLGIPTEYAWALELLDGKHFPMRVIGYEKDGSEAGRAEVTKFDKKPVAATLFDIPAGYKVTDVQSLMQQMMSGHGRPPGGPGGAAVSLPKKHK